MKKKKASEQPLGHRERQIMDVVYRFQEASVGDVLGEIENPPSYSAIRKMLGVLEQKGFLVHRREGTKYLYKPTKSRQSAGRSAVKHLLNTFFAGSTTEAVNTILDVSSDQLTNDDVQRLRDLIDNARQEEK